MVAVTDIQYAGFWQRMGADLVDNLILLPFLSAVVPTQMPATWTVSGVLQAAVASAAAHPLAQFLELVFAVAYSVIFWMRFLGTPGKLLFHCHLVDATTYGPLTLRQSLLRNLGYLVSWGTLGLGFLWIAWDPRKQGFHDKIAGSVVLKVPVVGRRQRAL